MIPMSAVLPAGIALLGPTGSGKSALAMELARHLPVEIVSVDSAQVYRGMDIGTAKPSAQEQRAVPHHLIDIRDPEEAYSAGQFRADVLQRVNQIAARGRIPLLAGGTMLYFRALFRGIAALPTADDQLRADIDAAAAEQGWPALHAQLARRDPAAAARIHPHDAQRIQRALEIGALTGRAIDELWVQEESYSFDDWTIGVLEPGDRSRLHDLLAMRFDMMLAAGFVEEVRRLLDRPGMSEESHTMRMVGYRQLAAHVMGHDSLHAATAKAVAATRQLAKRQLTWLRSGKVLPSGAKMLRADAFDDTARLELMRLLIQAHEPA